MLKKKDRKVILKTEEEIEILRQNALLVGRVFGELASLIQPGVSTLQLDKRAEEFIRDNGAVPAFKNYAPGNHPPFPATLCVSINEEVVHGLPSASRYLEDGDIIAVDCGVYKDKYFGDSAYTFSVGNVSADVEQLLRVTKESLYKAIDHAHAGMRLGDIGHAVQSHVEQYGYGVVRNMVGHGLGRSLHEAPEVANFGRRGNGMRLAPGLVICIEPMINMGRADIKTHKDGWTTTTIDNKPSAHFEHTVVVRKGAAEILTTFDYIEQSLVHV